MALKDRRLNAFQVFDILQQRIIARQPTTVIRLGDGEGALLGYPRITIALTSTVLYGFGWELLPSPMRICTR